MSALILRGDAANLPLADESVDLIVTSPPYFGLRSYTDGGEHYAGQIGSEATPREFLGALQSCTREWMRVLKPEGSLFVNLGDKYRGSASGGTQNGACGKRGTDGDRKRGHIRTAQGLMPQTDVPAKSLLGMPWRYALGCIDDLGLILRRDIIWSKPNGLPESVTDRCRSSHEYLFHLTKQPRYFAAVDEIREDHSGPWKSPGGSNPAKAIGPAERGGHSQWERTRAERDATVRNPLGKLPGSVWEIPSQPLTVPAHLGVDHFAAFPMELPRRIILGWSPSGVCTACGQGRRPVVDKALQIRQRHLTDRQDGNGDNRWGTSWRSAGGATEATITGYACACPDATAQTRPALVLDPFGGTGTTALVASAYGRTGISVDRSADYCRLARWRTTDPAERARAMQVAAPPPVISGQGELFDVLGTIGA